MKKISLAFILILVCLILQAQTPNSFKYQALARTVSGEIMENEAVEFTITILENSITGTPVYSEAHSVTTNQFGLVSFNIGEGMNPTSTFADIDWTTGIFFVEIKLNGNLIGTSQLLSVPFAKYADNAGNTFSGDYNDLSNTPEFITKYEFDSVINAIKLDLYKEVWLTDTSGKFIDERDNQIYQFAKIGEQVWMSENLNYFTSSGSYYYDNDSISYAEIYGRLYDWETANNSCPIGWHLPTENEYNELIIYLGGESIPGEGYCIAGGKLKEESLVYWQSPNTNATNTSNFSALPAGFYTDSHPYNLINQTARFWTSTDISDRHPNYANAAATIALDYNSDKVFLPVYYLHFKPSRLSVRCIKDSE
jgi:uncharacterized protein (TIGR02145 family)